MQTDHRFPWDASDSLFEDSVRRPQLRPSIQDSPTFANATIPDVLKSAANAIREADARLTALSDKHREEMEAARARVDEAEGRASEAEFRLQEHEQRISAAVRSAQAAISRANERAEAAEARLARIQELMAEMTRVAQGG